MPYTGKEDDDNMTSNKSYTMNDLYSMIPASNQEIDQALMKLHVVEVGKLKALRMLSKDILNKTTRDVLDTIISNDWSLDSISESRLISSIEDVDETFIKHILSTHGKSIGNGLWNLNEDEVAKSTADMLLRYRTDNTKVSPLFVQIFFSEFDVSLMDVVMVG